MKRTILSLMIVGMFVTAGAPALANDSTTKNQATGSAQDKAMREGNTSAAGAVKDGKPGMPNTSDAGVKKNAKADHKAAQDKVNAQFKDAKAKCDLMQGDAMRSCNAEAKAAQSKGLEQAKSDWELQGKAKDKESNAAPRPGSANSAQVGGAPDTTPSSQQNASTTGQGAANGGDKTASSQADYVAATEKAQGEYSEAMAKCDALQNDAKGSCITNAKSAQSTAMNLALTERQDQDDASMSGSDVMDRSSSGQDIEGGVKPEADVKKDGASQNNTK